jgi:hypothetical protein
MAPDPPARAPDRDPRPDLLSLVPEALDHALAEHFRSRGQPAFRAGQVRKWVYETGVTSFQEMTNLPQGERDALEAAFRLEAPAAATVSRSSDGTVKHLWTMEDGELIESVLIPTPERLTLCISSQAGCAMGCTFCATGWGGFGRQLTAGEIVAQYRGSRAWAEAHDYGPITNVVFMGMGEPLANRKAVHPALTILNAGLGVGARRITVSTVGVVPGIRELAARPEQFGLALSLHAPVESLRAELIPLEKRHPLPGDHGCPPRLPGCGRAPHHLRVHHDPGRERRRGAGPPPGRTGPGGPRLREPHPLQPHPRPGLAPLPPRSGTLEEFFRSGPTLEGPRRARAGGSARQRGLRLPVREPRWGALFGTSTPPADNQLRANALVRPVRGPLRPARLPVGGGPAPPLPPEPGLRLLRIG